MADIFISYSQGAPEPTQALAADLAKQRYAVWFDSRMLPMEVFWKVIQEKIRSAKAVIVIWSPPSITSEWVYSEAKLGHDLKKLICVRTPDVLPADVPLPFNGYNLSLVSEREKIYESLTRLAVPQAVAAAALPQVEREASEAALAWDHIKASRDVTDFELFFRHYGDGHAFYGSLAAKKIAELKGVSATAVRPPAAVAIPKAEDVFLRIEAGMHTAIIRRISITADGRTMASASDDKTVRLWSLPDGALIRTLRPPIGPGDDGKVYAVALAPDGRWLAAGGWDPLWTTQSHMFVSIFDPATGAVTHRLGPLPGVVLDLKVSPCGDFLVAGLDNKNGVRVWETKTWRQVAEDRDYGANTNSVAFAADGRWATSSNDSHIRLYGPDWQLTKKAKAPGGALPFGISFSPDGTRLAVGYDDTPRVDVMSGQTLEFAFSADTSGVDSGNLVAVTWLANGARLAAAGTHYPSERRILSWADKGRGSRDAFLGTRNTVMNLVPWGQGLAFGAAGPALGLLDSEGNRVLFHGPPMADLRDKHGQHFLVSPDGGRARFGLKPFSEDPCLFDLAELNLTPSPSAPPGLNAADVTSLQITGWEGTTQPKLNGKPLPLDQYETAFSLAIAPGAESFVLGTHFWLRRFDKDGKQLWRKPVPGVTWGVNLARDGGLILAAYGDGTLRWHRSADGEELLALFMHVPEDSKAARRWVLWTPEGHYTASPGAEDLIGWHVNRGPDKAADFFPAETFRSTFHKPDLVLKALDKADR